MKTGKTIIFSALVCATVGFTACEKDDVKPTTPAVEPVETYEIVQHLTYQDQTYELKFTYDKNDSLIELTGDVAEVAKFQGKAVPPAAYLVEQPDEDVYAYNIHVFDTDEEMDSYRVKEGMPIPAEATVDRQCSQYTSVGGTANYRFYEHSNFSNELNYLTTNNQSYFQRDFYSAENDKISSLQIWGTTTRASVDLFADGCFSGLKITFVSTAPGQVFSMSNLNSIGIFVLTPYYDLMGNYLGTVSTQVGTWNDRISSVKGWSIQ